MFQHTKPLYDLNEGFELAGVKRSHGFKEIKAGRLKVIKNGKRTLITAQAIDDYIALLEKETQEQAA